MSGNKGMEHHVPAAALALDLKETLAENRLVGLWRMMKGFRLLYLGAMTALALGSLIRLLHYALLRYVIDSVFTRGLHLGQLSLFAMAFVIIAALEGAFAYLHGNWSARTAEGITLRLRNYLFDHLQRLPFAYHDHARTGELIQRVTSDVDALRRFFADQAVGVGQVLIMLVVNMAMLLHMNGRLGLLSVAIMPLVLVMSYFFFGRVSKAYVRYQQQEAALSARLQENLTGMRVVRAFARQEYEAARFDRENVEKYRRGKKLVLMHAAYWPLSDVLCAAQILLVMAVGGSMVMDGSISVGTFVTINSITMRIIWPLRNLGRLIVQVSTGLVSYRRVMAIISQEREDIDAGSVPADQPVRGEVVFEQVGLCYTPPPPFVEGDDRGDGRQPPHQERRSRSTGHSASQRHAAPNDGDHERRSAPVQVLHDISFRCAPGQVVALLGSTGSGKTSIVNLLLRFYDYTQGSIRIDGIELREYPPAALRRQIGIVEQEPFLFSRTIRENIAYGASRPVDDREIEEAARAAAIHDIIMSFPDGYDTIVGEKGITLSGGQRQRIAIARTLLRDPRILILDDATSSVDTETEAQIRDALTRLMRGRTSFVIAHRVQSVMDADLILVLDRGRIVQRGTHKELMCQEGMYRHIYDDQARVEQELQGEVEGDRSSSS